MISRRRALGLLTATPLAAALAGGSRADDGIGAVITPVELRGSLDAGRHGLLPGAADSQSRRMQAIVDKATAAKVPVFLPPGTYRISNLTLPDGAHITGVPGASRLVYGGDGHFMRADDCARITLSNLVIDGANGWLADHAPALVHLRGVGEAVIDNCEIAGSRASAVQMERSGGRIERSRLTGAADYGLYAVESTGLSITANTVSDCGNGGILVHRWTKGEDRTLIHGNRVTRIRATRGGTGQYGNGINLFRADGVSIAGNHVSDCAFSAIRCNAASNALISGNHCLGLGETALYAEFGFEGAVVTGNIVDGAANGISIVNFNEGGRLASVTGNIVRNLSLSGPYEAIGPGFGIGIAVEADTALSANVVENAPKWGMLLGWGPYLRNVSATGNVVRNAPTGIAVSVVEGAGTTLISGNLLDATPLGAIVGHRWTEAASGDLMAGGRYRHLSIDGNRAV